MALRHDRSDLPGVPRSACTGFRYRAAHGDAPEFLGFSSIRLRPQICIYYLVVLLWDGGVNLRHLHAMRSRIALSLMISIVLAISVIVAGVLHPPVPGIDSCDVWVREGVSFGAFVSANTVARHITIRRGLDDSVAGFRHSDLGEIEGYTLTSFDSNRLTETLVLGWPCWCLVISKTQVAGSTIDDCWRGPSALTSIESVRVRWAAAIVNVFAFGVPPFVLTCAWCAWRRKKSTHDELCGVCGYDLRLISSHSCPECGNVRGTGV